MQQPAEYYKFQSGGMPINYQPQHHYQYQSPHYLSNHQYQEVHPMHHHLYQYAAITATNIDDHNQQHQLLRQYAFYSLAVSTTNSISRFQHQQNYDSQLKKLLDLNLVAATQTLPGSPYIVTLNCRGHEMHFDKEQGVVNIQVLPLQVDTRIKQASSANPELSDNQVSASGSQSPLQEVDVPPMHSTASEPQNHQANCEPPTESSSNTNQLPAVDEQTTKSKRKTSKLPAECNRCNKCDEVFNKLCHLKLHMEICHSTEYLSKWQECHKRFQSDKHFNIHLAKHKPRTYLRKCNICFKHKIKKLQSKANKCDLCHKTFARRKNYLVHTCKSEKLEAPAREIDPYKNASFTQALSMPELDTD